ncbi:MAG: tRNA-dihydrouridine synthase family protein [Desulfobacteraceae bacterium]|jgi:nifR3 family TIM-barrel protein
MNPTQTDTKYDNNSNTKRMTSNHLTALLSRPLQIGSKTITNRLILAPMTFLGHVAFRQVLDELGGCGLMYSEMCSAGRIPQEDRHASPYFRWRDEEAHRLVIQMVGNKPARMVLAARRIEAEGLWGVDINMGCATTAICRHNLGAALLKDRKAALDLVRKVRRAVQCPVTVKFRTGWQDNPRIPVDFARGLEDAGVDALTFHPRMAPDRRNRPPNWEYIGMVKQAVSIPVFGNGDVFDAGDCLRMMQTTGCDGVALGRMAIAKPWVFAQWTRGLDPPADICKDVALRLSDLLQRYYDSKSALRRFKRYAAYLAAIFVFGNTLYNGLRNAEDFEKIIAVLNDFFSRSPKQLRRPNMNFLR